MLKLLAIIAMVIDHIGILFTNDNYWFRFIGRIAFPLFAGLLAYNYFFRTSNQRKFFHRLIIFAFISQSFYMFAFQTVRLNIFFQFVFTIWTFNALNKFIIQNNVKNFVQFFIVFTISFFLSIYTSYQGFGFLIVFTLFIYFYSYKNNFYNSLLFKFLLIFLLLVLLVWLNPIKYWPSAIVNLLLVIYLPSIEQWKKEYFKQINKKYRYLFYWFYPIHIFLLKLFQIFL